jgi:hypothetical protein
VNSRRRPFPAPDRIHHARGAGADIARGEEPAPAKSPPPVNFEPAGLRQSGWQKPEIGLLADSLNDRVRWQCAGRTIHRLESNGTIRLTPEEPDSREGQAGDPPVGYEGPLNGKPAVKFHPFTGGGANLLRMGWHGFERLNAYYGRVGRPETERASGNINGDVSPADDGHPPPHVEGREALCDPPK